MMIAPDKNEHATLSTLGLCLRQARLQRELRQATMAQWIGVSLPTYRKMEQGNPSAPLGYWIRAYFLLNSEARPDEFLEKFGECGCSEQRIRVSKKNISEIT